jgi:cytidyltransferase-like protein
MIIGFTIGVFDCFHAGHRNLLLEANSKCDILLVGVVTDWLTTMQKGRGVPVDTYDLRVSHVKKLLPLAKIIEIGDIHISKEIVDVVDVAFAGPDQLDRYYLENKFKQMELIPRTKDISSTLIRERINENTNK